MNVGGQILWNVTAFCETSQICYLLGRRPMKDVLGNHFKDRLIRLVHWVEYHTTTAKDQIKNPSIWKESRIWIVPRIRSERGEELGRVT